MAAIQNHSKNSTRTCLVWCNFTPKSQNRKNTEHWTARHKENKQAALAWLETVRCYELRSSDFVGESLMMTISAAAAKDCGTP